MRMLVNTLTFARIVLLPVIHVLVFLGRLDVAAYVLVIAGMTDILDGYLARLYRVASVQGAVFDSLADYAYYLSFAVWLVLLYSSSIVENIFLVGMALLLTLITCVLLVCSALPPPHLNSSRLAGFSFFILMISLFLNKSHFLITTASFIIWNAALIHFILYKYVQYKLNKVIIKLAK